MFENIIFDPPIPREYIFALGALAAVVTILNYWRARRGVGAIKRTFIGLLRLGVVVALTIILLRPMVVEGRDVLDKRSVFTIIVDESESMNTTDMDGKSRYATVIDRLKEVEGSLLAKLRQDYDVEFQTFSDSAKATTYWQLLAQETVTGSVTDLSAALFNLGNSASSRSHAGALLISDGRSNEGGDPGDAARYLKSLNLPVWVTTVGTATESKDLFVSAYFNQSFLFAGQDAALRVYLGHTGYEGWYAKVTLLRDGVPVATEQVILSGLNTRLNFPINEELKGTYRYTVNVEPLAGEADTKNNARSVFVQVVDEKAKVLVLEAKPYWDSKFLLRALQADPNLEVTAVFDITGERDKIFAITQAQPDRPNAVRTVRLPRTREELARYDCIILGRGIDNLLTAAELRLFKEYVEQRGGGLIFARGKSYSGSDSELADLEPIVWDEGGLARARFQLTPAGRINPIFDFGSSRNTDLILRELPEMISIAKVKREKSLAIILAKGASGNNAEEIATISYQRYGKGKVMTVGASGLWQWSFMRENLSQYDEVYARFWGQMIRWLVYGSDFLPGQDISFHTDRFSYSAGESVPLVIQTKNVDLAEYAPRIEIVSPEGTRIELLPEPEEGGGGLYSVAFVPEMEGDYKAVLHSNVGAPDELSVEFGVYSDALERRHVAADPDTMNRIAETTGGKSLALDEWESLANAVRDFELASHEELEAKDVWDTLRIFAILMGVLAVEWFIRRKSGLV